MFMIANLKTFQGNINRLLKDMYSDIKHMGYTIKPQRCKPILSPNTCVVFDNLGSTVDICFSLYKKQVTIVLISYMQIA